MGILFLHISKTGGTYVDSLVHQAGIHSLHQVEGSEPLAAAINSGALYISGHFTMNDLITANRDITPYKLVTNIRNPVDRFFSDINYHVEILNRGKEFYMLHHPYVRTLIARTYLALRDAQEGRASSMSHLFQGFLQDFYARKVLSQASIDALQDASVRDAIEILSIDLNSYYWIGRLEENGADQLLRITCEELLLNPFAVKLNRNESRSYANPQAFLGEIKEFLSSGNSHASNLLYLHVSGFASEAISEMSWSDLSTFATKHYFLTSRYHPASLQPLPEIRFELEI